MKNFFRSIISIFGIFLIMNSLWAFFSTSSNLGNYVCLFVGVVFSAFGVLRIKPDSLRKSRALTYLKNFVFAVCIVMVAFSFFLEFYGRCDNLTYREDVLIVLGAGVRGETVSQPLAERLDEAIRYLEKNKDATVVVSGGKGDDENVSEAEAMEKYLLNNGIDKKRIIKEGNSVSTYENFKFSKKILDKKFGSEYSVAFVTSNFHVFRAERIASEAGLDCTHGGSPVSWYSFWPCTLREGLAVAKNFVLGK